MASVDSYISDLAKLERTLPDLIAKIIAKNEGKLLSMLKLRLWNTGTDARGALISPSYLDVTIEQKKFENKRSSHVTLRDTGAFYAGMFIQQINDTLIVGSTDSKTPSLISKYGSDILGLNEDEQYILINGILEPEVQKILNELPDINLFE